MIDRPATPDATWSGAAPTPATSQAQYRVFNIGNNSPVELMSYIHALEDCLGKKAKMNMLPMQPGDVAATNADVSRLQEWVDFRPQTRVEDGIARFVEWYREYYKV